MRGGGARAAVVLALLVAGCGDQPAPQPEKKETAPASSSAPVSSSAPPSPVIATAGSADKGKQVWLGQCIACHNPDPTKDGPLGPAVKGASRALVEARVVRGEYPAGYTPKRPTKVMPPRPDLAPSVADLAAYLQ